MTMAFDDLCGRRTYTYTYTQHAELSDKKESCCSLRGNFKQSPSISSCVNSLALQALAGLHCAVPIIRISGLCRGAILTRAHLFLHACAFCACVIDD